MIQLGRVDHLPLEYLLMVPHLQDLLHGRLDHVLLILVLVPYPVLLHHFCKCSPFFFVFLQNRVFNVLRQGRALRGLGGPKKVGGEMIQGFQHHQFGIGLFFLDFLQFFLGDVGLGGVEFAVGGFFLFVK